jgi:hypothetical protein
MKYLRHIVSHDFVELTVINAETTLGHFPDSITVDLLLCSIGFNIWLRLDLSREKSTYYISLFVLRFLSISGCSTAHCESDN